MLDKKPTNNIGKDRGASVRQAQPDYDSLQHPGGSIASQVQRLRELARSGSEIFKTRRDVNTISPKDPSSKIPSAVRPRGNSFRQTKMTYGDKEGVVSFLPATSKRPSVVYVDSNIFNDVLAQIYRVGPESLAPTELKKEVPEIAPRPSIFREASRAIKKLATTSLGLLGFSRFFPKLSAEEKSSFTGALYVSGPYFNEVYKQFGYGPCNGGSLIIRRFAGGSKADAYRYALEIVHELEHSKGGGEFRARLKEREYLDRLGVKHSHSSKRDLLDSVWYWAKRGMYSLSSYKTTRQEYLDSLPPLARKIEIGKLFIRRDLFLKLQETLPKWTRFAVDKSVKWISRSIRLLKSDSLENVIGFNPKPIFWGEMLEPNESGVTEICRSLRGTPAFTSHASKATPVNWKAASVTHLCEVKDFPDGKITVVRMPLEALREYWARSDSAPKYPEILKAHRERVMGLFDPKRRVIVAPFPTEEQLAPNTKLDAVLSTAVQNCALGIMKL